jgi:redox-sensitive bicupin YhaK (pirin superfamily)
MSNLDPDPRESSCGGVAVAEPSPPPSTLLPREVPLGGPKGILVRRALPHRSIRTVGAWCFADHYGPITLTDPAVRGMVVPPHPHIGLQTVTWLLAGEVEHRDSVGSFQQVRPGELSLMTAGRGIAHSEYSRPVTDRLFGVQLWVALAEGQRDRAPGFEHHGDLPRGEHDGVAVTVITGTMAGLQSPASTYSPLVGAELRIPPGTTTLLPVERDFEYGMLTLDGAAEVAGEQVPFGALRYLGWGRDGIPVASSDGATLLLLGGEPLAEHLLMWWNFVGRDHDEIVAAREDWEAHRRFGEVAGDSNPRIPAPPLPSVRMMPRPPRNDRSR